MPRVGTTKLSRVPTPDDGEETAIDEFWRLSDSAYAMLPLTDDADFHGDPIFEMAALPTAPEETEEEAQQEVAAAALNFDDYDSHLFMESMRENRRSISTTAKLGTQLFRPRNENHFIVFED